MAVGEIPDKCSTGAIGTVPDGTYTDPTIPWLDLCDTDVSGQQGAGPLRAIKVTFHIGGDIGMRQGAAAYAVELNTKRCGFQIQYSDAGIDTTGSSTRVQGSCDVPGEPCPVLSQYVACWQSTDDPSDQFDLGAAAVTTAMTNGLMGSTITLTFDPNKVGIPQALAQGLAAGSVLDPGLAVSFARAGATSPSVQGYYDPVDFGYGQHSIALG